MLTFPPEPLSGGSGGIGLEGWHMLP